MRFCRINMTVEEVGWRVGYGGSGYFVRTFRRAHGAIPHLAGDAPAARSKLKGGSGGGWIAPGAVGDVP